MHNVKGKGLVAKSAFPLGVESASAEMGSGRPAPRVAVFPIESWTTKLRPHKQTYALALSTLGSSPKVIFCVTGAFEIANCMVLAKK